MKTFRIYEKELFYKSILMMVVILVTFGVAGCGKDNSSHSSSRAQTTAVGSSSSSDTSSVDSQTVTVASTEVKLPGWKRRARLRTAKLRRRLKRASDCAIRVGERMSVPKLKGGGKYWAKNEKVVFISNKGNVYGLKPGKTAVFAKGTDGKIFTYKITVKKGGMMCTKLVMLKGEKLDLKYQFSNKLRGLKWTSSNKKIAKVSKKGYVTTKKKGHVRIIGIKKGHTYVCRISVKKKAKSIIYLTFDDGPSSNITPKILNVLRKEDVPATFFELRPASYDYDLTRRVINEGHSLALHGFSHTYGEIYKSKKTYHENLDKLQKLFYKEFGVWCTVSRFPGGSSNHVSGFSKGVMTKITKKIHKWGYHYFDWNVSSGDAGIAYTENAVYRNVIAGLRKNQENVVLMHDAAPKTYTLKALPRIIKYGKKHGYKFRAITPATAEVHHSVWN